MARCLEDAGINKKSRNATQVDKKVYSAPDSVRCIDCKHAEPVDWHSALVKCKAGEPPPLCGLFWKTDRRGCRRFRGGNQAN